MKIVGILSRASAITLKAPGPDPASLQEILRAGTRAPDHGKLQPWRFIVIEGEARHRLGDAMARCLQKNTIDATEIEISREREKAFRAPLIVAVGAKIIEGRIPAIEQEIAAACAAQNVVLAAHLLGYGTMWKTGNAAYDDDVKQLLGLDRGDKIVGFIYLGTPDAMPKSSRETKLNEVIAYL